MVIFKNKYSLFVEQFFLYYFSYLIILDKIKKF
jgi:hypothetical protein